MSDPIATLLLGATWAVPLVLLLACVSGGLRRVMPRLLVLAPIPALAAAIFALQAPALQIGAGRLRLVFELDGPGALLLGVASLLWIAAGAYATTYMSDTSSPGRFVACWLMALTGCLGVFVAGDLVSLYAMLAMLTLGASGLVIHDETPRAWRSGSIYLVLALLAESVLLVGFVMLAGEIPGDSLRLRDAAAALAGSPDRDLILARLPDYMGLPFEAMCRDWVRMASAAGALAQRVGRVGTWWNPDHQLDIVGLDEDGRAALLGEAKWHTQPFDYQELERYLGHVRALGNLTRPDTLHLLFARAGFADDVRRWADAHNARLLTPESMLANFNP